MPAISLSIRPGVLPFLRRLRFHPTARSPATMIGSQALVALLQGLQFFLVARALGAHEFGRVASVIAITAALLPFSGLGLGNVAIMRIARGQARATLALGNGLAVTAITASLGVALALLLGDVFLGDPDALLLVALFGISEILLTKVVDLAAHVFLGLEWQAVTALFYVLLMFMRAVFASILFWGIDTPTALDWAGLHLVAGAVSAAVTLYFSVRLLGRPRTAYEAATQDIRRGFFFSVVIAARAIHTDADKTVLARMASAATAGAYTAAFRLVYMAVTPISAVLASLQARIFRKGGEKGLVGSLAAVRRLSLIAAAYSFALAVFIYVAAPAVPWLLGSSYQLTVDMLRALCLLPFLVILQALASDALSGADAQRRVSSLHAATAILSILLNLLLVPMRGWTGAVMAAYASQAFLVASLLINILIVLNAQRRGPRE